jgi:carbon starvation protein CstA
VLNDVIQDFLGCVIDYLRLLAQRRRRRRGKSWGRLINETLERRRGA